MMTLRRLNIVGLLLLIQVVALAPVQATQQQPAYDNPDSPVDLLASYYDAINLQDYPRAYAYWETAPRSYSAFVSGFADTVSIQLIVEPPTRVGGAAGSLYVEIPTVLLAAHRDGTRHTYAGCFVTRTSNVQSPGMPEDVWHLYSARLHEVSNRASIPDLLDQACAA